ncbi:MAG: V-type ATP synthase subunit F [Coriobacteriia bacterium]|nr:V-type ATP synthase subunit F [Coriobacteriia bacterium]
MYKLIVLTDTDTADGFGLAGVDVIAVEGPEEARRMLNQLIDDDTSGIVAVNEAYMVDIDERTQQKINQTYRPIVITLPIREKLEAEEDHRAYLARLIRRAIGFDITLRRG